MRFTLASFVVMCSGAQENDICNSVHGTACTDLSVNNHKTGVWTHEACCQACQAQLGCRAWSWNFKDGHCHLKKSCYKQVSNPDYQSGMIDTSPNENQTYIIEADFVGMVHYGGDGKHLASSGLFDGFEDTVHIWDTTTGELLQGLAGKNCVVVGNTWLLRGKNIAYSGDGKHLAAACENGDVYIWDVATGKVVRHMHTGHFRGHWSAAYSADSTRLVMGSAAGIIRVCDTTASKTLHIWKGYSCPNDDFDYCDLSVHYSLDGKHIASQFGYEPEFNKNDRLNLRSNSTIQIWDATTGEALHDFAVQGSLVAYSRDGNQLIVVVDKIIQILNSTTGEVVQTFKGHTGSVNSVDYSVDGKYIASGSEDNTVRIWDATTGKSLHTLKGMGEDYKGDGFNSVAYSADGKQLAGGNSDSKIYIWDLTYLLSSSLTLVASPYAAHYAVPVVV